MHRSEDLPVEDSFRDCACAATHHASGHFEATSNSAVLSPGLTSNFTQIRGMS